MDARCDGKCSWRAGAVSSPAADDALNPTQIGIYKRWVFFVAVVDAQLGVPA